MESEVTTRTAYESKSWNINEGFEQIENPMSIPGFRKTTNFRPNYAAASQQTKKKGLIARVFSNLSRLGMEYDDQVVANMRAIPADPNLVDKQFKMMNGDLTYECLQDKFIYSLHSFVFPSFPGLFRESTPWRAPRASPARLRVRRGSCRPPWRGPAVRRRLPG